MITKDEIVEMLSFDNDILNYVKLRTDFSTGYLYQLAPEDAMTVMVRCIDAHEKIIQTILAKLDVTIEPTETTVT